MSKQIILIIALLVSCSALQSHNKLTHADKQNYEEIRNGKSWAGIFLKMAEVSVMTQGPLDQLIEAIEDAQEDLAAKQERADEAFRQRTDQHNAEVSRLESAIARTETEIESIEDTLQMLADQKAALEEENRMLNNSNDNLRTHLQEAGVRRRKENEAFQTAAVEYEESISAVEECLDLLSQLRAQPSLVQITKIQKSFSKVHAHLEKSHSMDAQFVKAYIELANNQEFTDQSALNTVIAKFNEILGNLNQSATKAALDEAQAQEDYEQDVIDSNNEINANTLQIGSNNDMLVTNANNTEENRNLLAIRNQDLRDFQQELADENDRYENDTRIYEDLCAQFAAERDACAQALTVLSTADFSDYISDRVQSEDGLVSSGMRNAQQHGQGGEVFEFDYRN